MRWMSGSAQDAAFAQMIPELYFCDDIKGYGWCFRKENFLNIGLGRMDPHRLSEHVTAFVRFLQAAGRITFDVPSAMLGHAYLLYGVSERKPVDDGMLLIGDSVGLAYKQSGEGIRTAIESGLLAARAIVADARKLLARNASALRRPATEAVWGFREGLGVQGWRIPAVNDGWGRWATGFCGRAGLSATWCWIAGFCTRTSPRYKGSRSSGVGIFFDGRN